MRRRFWRELARRGVDQAGRVDPEKVLAELDGAYPEVLAEPGSQVAAVLVIGVCGREPEITGKRPRFCARLPPATGRCGMCGCGAENRRC